jgi:uncharacterized membrane protein
LDCVRSQTARALVVHKMRRRCIRRLRRAVIGGQWPRAPAARMPVERTFVGYALLKSIHLLGIIVWVGGMFFTVACLRPAAAALEPPARVALMRDALGRFLDIVLGAATLVLITGVWMIASASRVSVKAGIGFNMPLDWHAMVTLGVVMIAIFGYIRFALFIEVRRAAAAKEWPAAAAALGRIRLLVLVNLVLAVIIVVVTRLGAAG